LFLKKKKKDIIFVCLTKQKQKFFFLVTNQKFGNENLIYISIKKNRNNIKKKFEAKDKIIWDIKSYNFFFFYQFKKAIYIKSLILS